MKTITLILSFLLLTSCSSSDDKLSVNGTWSRCYSIATNTYLYEELIISGTSFESTTYSALDSQCITVERQPEAGKLITTASLAINNPHISINNLLVYDLTLSNRTQETNIGLTTLSNFYTIIHTDNDKLYFGKSTGANDGSTPELRNLEINLDIHLNKQ